MLEFAAIAFTLISVWLSRKENIWCWLTGMIGTTCYFFIFMHDKSYANALLQFVFMGQAIYGWLTWGKKTELLVEESTGPEIAMQIMGIVLMVVLGSFVNGIANGELTFPDLVTTAISIVGLHLIAHKKVENWLYWIAADVFYIILFIQTRHYFSAALYALLIFNATYGFIQWKRNIKAHTSSENSCLST